MDTSYTPVPWVYREVIEEEINKQKKGNVVYFGNGKELCSSEGRVVDLIDVQGQGVFIELDPASRIRIDRIITLFGKPGAAFDEYDAYANACLDCMGGYEKEDLE